MPFITREDGERFVVPAYRDVLSAKKPTLLKKEIMMLSTKYGEYITLQRKTSEQYEVAFSPDSGYLLGETVWHQFKRPVDLIYCEAIPNTNEAILVIVKGNSVYLDGNFPIDSIPEELIIFKTQQNNFDVYIHGAVPISQELESGKFTLPASSVKSFTVLPAPVFPTLPKVKGFQLRLVDQVLRSQGIGVFPVKRLILLLVFGGLGWMAYSYFKLHEKELPQFVIRAVDPYQSYYATLQTPDPADEVQALIGKALILLGAPGWRPDIINYASGSLSTKMLSQGMRTNVLFAWGRKVDVSVNLDKDAFYASTSVSLSPRPTYKNIIDTDNLLASLIDKLSYISPSTVIKLSGVTDKGKYKEVAMEVQFMKIPLTTLNFIGQQLRGLPIVLTAAAIKPESDGTITGSISLKVLGN